MIHLKMSDYRRFSNSSESKLTPNSSPQSPKKYSLLRLSPICGKKTKSKKSVSFSFESDKDGDRHCDRRKSEMDNDEDESDVKVKVMNFEKKKFESELLSSCDSLDDKVFVESIKVPQKVQKSASLSNIFWNRNR